MKNVLPVILLILLSYHPIYSNIRNNITDKTLTDNVRIDPEWIKTYDAGGFSWAYDILADREGNTYSTGYFSRNLNLGKGQWIEPTTRCSSRCPDTYFLMKHDPEGNLLWISYGNGNSRPARIAMDPYGEIWVVGNDYGTSTEFHAPDGSAVTLKKSPDSSTGAFALRYNPQGKILSAFMIPGGENFDVNDLFIDPQGNFLIAGSYQFRNYERRSEVRRSYLLMKFHSDFTPDWELRGDTIGQSNLLGVCTDHSGNVYATGGYNRQIRLNKKNIMTDGSDAIPFVLKINHKGRVKWMQDSLGTFRSGNGKNIVCDSRGEIYTITGTSYSLNLISRLHPNGSLAWSHTIRGKGSNYFERLVIDDADQLYLCGQGYGTTFETAEGKKLHYQSAGGTDPYIVCYNTDGVLQWLRAAGGKGTDYLKSISVSNGKLYAFGWFGREMSFRDTVLSSRSGYVFWQARFDIELLSRMDLIPPSKQTITPPDTVFDLQNCTCTRKPSKKTPVFFNSMNSLITYDQFAHTTGWTSPYPESSFKFLFYKNFQFSTGYQSGFYSLTAIGIRKPITLIHPSGTYAINFTPCTHNLLRYELPLTVSYDNKSSRHLSGFDPEEFDYSARSYFEIFLEIEDLEMEDLAEEETLPLFNTAIQQNDLSLLDEAFMTYSSNISVEWINSLLNPDIHASFDTKHIGVEFNPGILRPWNTNTRFPVTDSTGKPIPYMILTKTPKGINYHNESGIRLQTGTICAPIAEITNTGWLLKFTEMNLISEPKNMGHTQPEEMQKDTGFTRFTGLHLQSAQLSLPFRGQYIQGVGNQILLNNYFIAGTLNLPIANVSEYSYNLQDNINLKTDQGNLPISLQELKATLAGIGFQDIHIQKEEQQVIIIFKKKI